MNPPSARFESKRSPASDLPNELLYKIFDHFDDGSLRLFPPERTRIGIYDTLARVCRRWKLIVKTYLWRSVAHRSVQEFSEYWGPGNSRPTAHLVRRLGVYGRYGPRNDNTRRLYDLITRPADFPFKNLRALENFASISSHRLICVLSVACPRLENLQLFWDSREELPGSELLPNLKTLRLHIGYTHSLPFPKCPKHPLPLHLPFNHLTSLFICNPVVYTPSPDHDFITRCCRIYFPQLRVLHFHDVIDLPMAYDFIQWHPSIREVTLKPTIHHYLRLESLIKLIDGTGVWKNHTVYRVSLDQPSHSELELNGGDPVPPRFHATYGAIRKFSFARRPLPDSSVTGVSRPLYKCVGLALHFQERPTDNVDPFPDQLGYEEFRTLEVFLRDLSTLEELSIFREIEELRIGCELYYLSGVNFEDIMVHRFQEGLRRLPCLRKFALWLPTYRSFALSEMSERPDKFPTIMDVSEKIFTRNDTDCDRRELDTLAEVRALYDSLYLWAPIDPENFESLVRSALCLEPDEDVDADHIDLMRVWEAYNEKAMQRIVRSLATSCHRLEQFEWWAMEYKSTEHRSIVWDWRVQRYRDAARLGRVKTLNGHLIWSESSRNSGERRLDQPSYKFPVLVGAELERFCGSAAY